MRPQVTCGKAGDCLLNYISEINGFERWLETHQLPILAQLLWYELIYWSSRSGWPEWTQVDNRRLMVSLQIAREASLTESRERLVNAGLIEYQKGKKGSPGRYRIVSFEEKTTRYTCDVKAQSEGEKENTYDMKVQPVTNTVRNPVVYPVAQSVGIIKEKDKNKNKNKPLSTQVVEKREGDSFVMALNRYTTYRETTGNPLTSFGLDMLLKRLEELKPGDRDGQTAILEQSIRNGWKDVYALDMGKLKDNQFQGFERRKTDYNALALEQVRARLKH